jgi:hypothetical protein
MRTPNADTPISPSKFHTTSDTDSGVSVENATGQSKKKGDPVRLAKGSRIARLIAMSKEDWMYGVLGLLGSIGNGIVHPLIAVLIGEMLAIYYEMDRAAMMRRVFKCSLKMVGLGIFSVLAQIVMDYPMGIMSERLAKRIREKMFASKYH